MVTGNVEKAQVSCLAFMAIWDLALISTTHPSFLMLEPVGADTKLDSFYFFCVWCRLWLEVGALSKWMRVMSSYYPMSFTNISIALLILHFLPGESFPIISNIIFIS